MFWADEVAQKIINSGKYKPYWVDDMKTPSGRVHVGALMGVVIHDLVYRALKDKSVEANYTYVFENHDPMDDIPSYLDESKYEKYLGMPLFKIPSPEPGFENFAAFYADEFQKTFNTIGSFPKILWTKDLYTSGKMNDCIKKVLDNAEEIRKIYEQMYRKEIAKDWYAFQVYCEGCGKVSTTKVYKWDGEFVYYRCLDLDWTKGCGYDGKTSPFSSANHMVGKMPWKVEWAVKWQAIGVTIEGAGKDHMSAGGSHDLASLVAEKVLKYPVPYPVGYEFMLIGGKKMSSSKGRGFAAADILDILPPELARFLIVRLDITKQTNFDPTEPETIPALFDEYQKAADAYFAKGNKDLARIFELSQIDGIKKPPSIRFSTLAQWVQAPNMKQQIERKGAVEWAKYAKYWVENFAKEEDKHLVSEETPENVKNLTNLQKKYLASVVELLEKDWQADDLQKKLYDLSKEMEIPTKDAFAAIYIVLIGKTAGPKAGALMLENKELAKKRFKELSSHSEQKEEKKDSLAAVNNKISSNIFSIGPAVKEKYPSVSVGVAVIKGVKIEKTNTDLEKEKQALLESLAGLTTEKLGQFPEIQAYRKLYKDMGIDWHSRRPSPEALLRRVALNKGLYTINTCVDAYNLVVMKHRVSVGAFDADEINFPTVLRFPKQTEEILLLGDEQPTQYKPTELAYFDQKGGFNIDFNYRDAQRTAVKLSTKNVYVNVDGIFDISPENVQKILQEACDMIVKYCGGKVEEFGVTTN